MKYFEAPFYSEEQEEEMELKDYQFPFSNKDMIYVGKFHQYELTESYFLEHGRNLQREIEGNDPEKVKHFLEYLRVKMYQYIYTHNKSMKPMLDYIIAVRGIYGIDPYQYREMFLEACFIEGCYLLDNGDISTISGIDINTMQNMSDDVVRNQDRDFHKNAIDILKTLGLKYYGKYNIILPTGVVY